MSSKKNATPAQEQPTDKPRMEVVIKAPNFQTVRVLIEGTSPLVQNRFSQKAQQQIRDAQEAGSTGKKNKPREPKDFQAAFRNAMHVSRDGWHGIPCAAFRRGMVAACRTVGYAMSVAKLAIFIEADGIGVDGIPLVKILKGEPQYFETPVRIKTTIDIRARPMFDPGWQAEVRIKFDADLFTMQDIVNLMHRLGLQVGIGEGRYDATEADGVGLGWGQFQIINGGIE